MMADYNFMVARPTIERTVYELTGRDDELGHEMTVRLTEEKGEPSLLEILSCSVYGIEQEAAATTVDIFAARRSFSALAYPFLGCHYPFEQRILDKVPIGGRQYLAPTVEPKPVGRPAQGMN